MFDFLDNLFNTTANADFTIDEEVKPDMAYLSDLGPGTEFLIGDEVYIVLRHTGTGESKVIRKELLPNSREFGPNADWKNSPIRDYLNEGYHNRIADVIGAENIVPMRRDLTSLDGLDDCGNCIDKVSMLTAAEYAEYHKVFGTRSRYSNWWWTITPYSTPGNGYSRCVCCVDSFGTLSWGDCDCCNGVRPFLSLNSSLLVSLHLENMEE